MAEVKLFDREAYIAYEDIGGAYVDVIRRGDWDHVAGVQAFAAHREAAEKAEREACAKVAELTDNDKHLIALLRREGTFSGVWFADDLLKAANLIERLATAIRARGDGGAAMDELIARDADLI